MSTSICPNHPPGHVWDNGLACRWCDATRTPGEAIVSGLASRRGGDRDSARALLDAYRAERDAMTVTWLIKKSREEKTWDAAVLASKVERGAVRPDNLRMLPNPAFFEPGRTYAHGEYRFTCEHLATHPTSGRISAWGWFGKQGAGWRHAAFSERQFAVRAWTEVTEGDNK